MHATDQPLPAARRSWRRGLLFRAAAVLLAVLPFAAGELLLRAWGWGRATAYPDPSAGFAAQPLFVLSDDGSRYEIPPSRQVFFRPELFAAKKGPREFRIFCLGGSTVQGNPYGIETSFTTWLELSLAAADSRREWQVVNCGGISYASYRLAPILQELLAHQPDLFILYTGHNEFLEERSYEHFRRRPLWLTEAHRAASRSRLYNVFRSALLKLLGDDAPAEPPRLPSEVDALLDHDGGLDKYRRDDARRQAIQADYEANLRRMIALAREAGVPVILCNPVSNLRDCPPFKSEPRAGISAAERARFAALWEEALAAPDLARWEERLRAALDLDDRQAAAHYHLAQCLEQQHRYAEAKEAYVRAKEEDVCPLRMLEPMHAVLRRLADQAETPLVDVRRMFEEASPHGLPGEMLLIDHVHPRIRGHQWIADALLDELTRGGWAQPGEGWRQERDAAYRRHLAALDYAYFVRGEEHLEGLRLWTQGRARPRLKKSGSSVYPPPPQR